MENTKKWLMDTTTFTKEANKMKEIFLDSMLNEGLLTNEQFQEFNNYCFVLAEKSFFGSIWDKILWKKDSAAVNIVVVKIISK